MSPNLADAPIAPLAIEQIEVEIEWLALCAEEEKAAALDGAAAV
jgi:hypothetical protein